MTLSDRTLRRCSIVLFGFFVVTAWGSVAIAVASPSRYADWGTTGLGGQLAFIVMLTLFPLVAMLIVRQQPRNRMGWVLHAIGFSWAVAGLADVYVGVGLELRPGSLPGGEVVEVLNSATWVPPIILMGVFAILLFPDGRPPSPRWRGRAWGAAVAGVAVFLAIVLSPGPVEDVLVPLAENPLGIDALRPLIDVLFAVGLPLIPVCIIAAAVALARRFRGSSGTRRLELAWLATAGFVVAVTYAASMVASVPYLFDDVPQNESTVSLVLQDVSILSFGLIPVAIGVAITRHGLYEMSGLIGRTLMVGALGVFITLVYVGVVVGVGAAIGQRQPSVWLSVGATAIVAVAFQPVRERMQRLVNRLVYGARATPYEVLSDFAVRMAGQYTTSELLPRMTQTVSESLGGARVEMWLLGGDRLTQEAAWPEGVRRDPVPVRDADDIGSLVDADRVVVVRHRGEPLGALAVSLDGREALTSTEETLLEHVASQAGLVLRNVRLVDDLAASRQRLVTSGDAQRRRIERNLHDGAQQSLVAVALMLRMAAARKDAAAMSTAVSEAADQLQRAIAELRELARGIHPAILTDRGLGPALASLADRCPVPVQLDNEVRRRLPGPIEATLYFVAAEALTNVAKYASASVVSLRLSKTSEGVALEIADDGRGGADPSGGTGLLGLADRAAVVGGALSVSSPPGHGTTIVCTVPVPSTDALHVPVDIPPGGSTDRLTAGLVSGASR